MDKTKRRDEVLGEALGWAFIVDDHGQMSQPFRVPVDPNTGGFPGKGRTEDGGFLEFHEVLPVAVYRLTEAAVEAG